MKRIFNSKLLIGFVMLTVGIFVGKFLFTTTHEQEAEVQYADAEVWTCSMHPGVRQSSPGKCPICGMDLIPLGDNVNTDASEVRMSATAVKLANIQTTTITTGTATKEIRLNGKVQPDERRVSSQAAHLPGRIEQLLINFTGEYVQKGTVIAQIYSPELVTAEQELFEAYKIRETQPALYTAAREKLKNWKLSDRQIDTLLATRKPVDRFPLHADVSGIILKRNVNVGDYVARGASLYEVVDLSRVWVLFDVYEADMQWIKKGSAITFTMQSLPGESFTDKIDFIDPVLNPGTRVATARVEMANPGLRLKPEMFATGIVKSSAKAATEIVLPKSAVMWTGERSVVYIKKQTSEGIAFVMKEVLLGPALGENYVIKEGLERGMEVVTNGTFTIDAAAQLAGQPSMMNRDGGEKSMTHQHDVSLTGESSSSSVSKEFKRQLTSLLDVYLKLKDALVASNAKEASAAAKDFDDQLQNVDMSLLDQTSHTNWMPFFGQMDSGLKQILQTNDIVVQRKSFSTISNAYYEVIGKFHLDGLNAYYEYCPMAFDNHGAYWISKTKEIKNPYFGSKMMTCGEVKEKID